MDAERFDYLLRQLSARFPNRRHAAGLLARLAVAGALGPQVRGEVTAKKGKRKKRKKKCAPKCGGKACGSDGCGGSCGNCAANQVCQGGTCCTPETAVATCAGRCGTWTNNCGQAVACTPCSGGRICLSNGSCAKVCASDLGCPASCFCAVGGGGSVEGTPYCSPFPVPLPCSNPQNCASTAECPTGQYCQTSACDPDPGRCYALCPSL